MQWLNVRISPSCPLDVRSDETCGCTSVPDQRLWSFCLSSILSFFLFFLSPLYRDALLLYSLLKVIRALNLLIIWTFTWVPIPSDIYPTFLWVAVAKVTLFACPLHINAARKVASLHLMRQLWSLPGHPILSSFSRLCEACSYYQYSLEWFLIMDRVHVWSIFGTSEETFLLGPLLK